MPRCAFPSVHPTGTARPNWRGTIALGLLAAAAMSGCASDFERYEYAEVIMGVEARVTLFAPDEEEARASARVAFDRMNELDDVLSDYRPDSEAMRLCQTHGEPVRVSADLYDVLSRSLDMSRRTGGLFDVTIGPVVQLWREARRARTLPGEQALRDARNRVGWELVRLDPATRSVTLDRAGMRLDFGGIGKGYAAQAAVDALRERGISSCLVDLGGDLVAGDPPFDADTWRVRVETGTSEPGVAGSASGDHSTTSEGAGGKGLVVPLADAAIATSGFNVQFLELRGVRYSHIVDPRTGLGVTNRTAACVIAPDGATADALASALSILGHDGAAQLMTSFPECAAMLEIETDDVPLRIFLNDFPQPLEE